MALKFIELFAGIGGFRNGLEACNNPQPATEKSGSSEPEIQQGREWSLDERGRDNIPNRHRELSSSRDFNCVWSNEWDKYAASIYRYQYGEICEADIRTVDYASIPDHDLCTFGWPCQDNSIAGGRAGQEKGARSSLFNQAIEILRVKKPNYFLAENVPGLFSVSGGYDFYEAIRMFSEVGYDVQWQVLNTRWFLPQNRERIFFIGHLRGQRRPQVFPIGETGSVIDEWNSEVANPLQLPGHSTGNYRGMTMVRLRSDRDYQESNISPPIRGENDKHEVRIVIQAGNRANGNPRTYHDIIPSMTQDYGTGGGNVPMVFSPTIRSEHHNTADVHIIPVGNKIRRLTPKECERLQGLPDDWTKYGRDINGKKLEISDTQRYKACGNGVSTPVITAIGNKLLQAMAFRPGAGE